jgi:hypothetical protein
MTDHFDKGAAKLRKGVEVGKPLYDRLTSAGVAKAPPPVAAIAA